MLRRILAVAGIFAIGFAAGQSAVEAPRAIVPLPAVVTFAREHGFALEGIAVAGARGSGKFGDSLTALMNLDDSHGVKQWMAEFVLAEPTARELADHPPGTITMTIDPKHAYRFAGGNQVALNIRVAGPFVAGKAPPTQELRARALASLDLLGLGLDESCRTMLKTSAPPPKGEKTITPTEAEQRSMVGVFPALISFVQTIQNTPGLKEILWETIDKPSAWSLLKNRGNVTLMVTLDASSSAAAVDRAPWMPSGFTLYRLDPVLTLNEKPALNCSLFVTSPKPPLLNTAGIVAIVATSPTKPKRLDIRVVSAKPVAGD